MKRPITFGRMRCIVPHCQCSVPITTKLGTEVICQKHWIAISAEERRAYNARKRDVMKRMTKEFPAVNGNLFSEITALNQIWDGLKKQAIEKAMGI